MVSGQNIPLLANSLIEDVKRTSHLARCWNITFARNDQRTYSSYAQLLTLEEQAHADHYRLPADRWRYVIARGSLRLILSAWIHQPPKDIQIETGEKRKPRLNESEIEFNVSHSGSVIAIAMMKNIPIGIDVEKVRKVVNYRELISRNFHSDEIADFSKVLDSEIEELFFRCWTRKEAVAKALGKGLMIPLDQYRVSFLPTEHPALLLFQGKCVRDEWTIIDLPSSNGYVQACAAKDPLLQVRFESMDAAMLWNHFRDTEDMDRLPLKFSERKLHIY